MYKRGPLILKEKIDNTCACLIQFTLVHSNDMSFRSYYYVLYPMDEHGPMTISLDNESGLCM